MNILAVDTTGEALSLAVQTEDRIFSFDRRLKAPHDETIVGCAERLLSRAKLRMEDLDAVAAASGPGRFTGIRIGMAYAAVAAAHLRVPAIAVSRFEAVASKRREPAVAAVIEGFRGERSYQLFKRGRAGGKPAWVPADAWPKAAKDLEERGFLLAQDKTGARDLLAAAAARLSRKKIPKFEPLYLKLAGYMIGKGVSNKPIGTARSRAHV